MRWRWIGVAAVAIGVVGCWAMTRSERPRIAVDAMRRAERFELISLEPGRGPTTLPSVGTFGQWPELGRTTVADRATRDRLTDAFRAAAFQNDNIALGCMFMPRHAIHLTRGNDTCDVVICFQCGEVQVTRSDGPTGWFFISRDVQPTFDDALRAAGVPLSTTD